MYNYEIDVLKKKASAGSAVVVSMDKYPPDRHVAVSEHTSDSFSEYHSHNYYEVNYVKKRDCVNLVDDHAVYMPEGSLIILHTGIFHSLFARQGSEIYNFGFARNGSTALRQRAVTTTQTPVNLCWESILHPFPLTFSFLRHLRRPWIC